VKLPGYSSTCQCDNSNETFQGAVLSVAGEVQSRCDSKFPLVGGLCDKLTHDDLVNSLVAHFDDSNATDGLQTEFPTSPLPDADSSFSGGIGLSTSFWITKSERASNR
jgi:hypothetical protein